MEFGETAGHFCSNQLLDNYYTRVYRVAKLPRQEKSPRTSTFNFIFSVLKIEEVGTIRLLCALV